MGTPQTLIGAIYNGFRKTSCNQLANGTVEDLTVIKTHVKDFLAQKFSVAFLETEGEANQAVTRLWEKITGEEEFKLPSSNPPDDTL